MEDEDSRSTAVTMMDDVDSRSAYTGHLVEHESVAIGSFDRRKEKIWCLSPVQEPGGTTLPVVSGPLPRTLSPPPSTL